MAQLFRPGANTVARLVLGVIVALPFTLLVVASLWAHSPYSTGEGRFVEQPVPFSHKHHAGELGIDCRYCHTGVESGARAVVPPTHTCMTCHSQLWTNSAMLAPVRKSFASGRPLRWSRVNRLPDHVYFDHHVHVNNGVPCAACHGDTRAMPLTLQAKPMTMGWCMDCHRDPASRLVPQSRIYDDRPYARPISAVDSARIHARLKRSPAELTDCSTCHR